MQSHKLYSTHREVQNKKAVCVNMGRRKSHSLLKLGQKKVPRKFWKNTGFGTGHYVYRHPLTSNEVSHLKRRCESKDGLEIWEEPFKQPTLKDMGLVMDEYGKIVPIKKV